MFDVIADALLNYQIITLLLLVFVLIPIYNRWQAAQSDKSRWAMRDIAPATEFLAELSKGSTAGYDKPLMAMLHPTVLLTIEKAVIRAVGRSIANTIGTFISIDPKTVTVKQDSNSAHLLANATFSNSKDPVKVEVSWKKKTSKAGWAIISFNVTPSPSQPRFNILKNCVADEFSEFGQSIVLSLLAKSPYMAFNVMAPQLKQKYSSEADLGLKLAPLLSASGGLKSKDTLTYVQGSKDETTGRISLQYHIAGNISDATIDISLTIINMQCYLAKFNAQLQRKAPGAIVDI